MSPQPIPLYRASPPHRHRRHQPKARSRAITVPGSTPGAGASSDMPPCAMPAAENDAIPEEVRAEVRRFVAVNVAWLATVLARRSSATPGQMEGSALALFAVLEGAMLIARGCGDITRFDAMAARLLHATPSSKDFIAFIGALS